MHACERRRNEAACTNTSSREWLLSDFDGYVKPPVDYFIRAAYIFAFGELQERFLFFFSYIGIASFVRLLIARCARRVIEKFLNTSLSNQNQNRIKMRDIGKNRYRTIEK
jgi:hypothetical protein